MEAHSCIELLGIPSWSPFAEFDMNYQIACLNYLHPWQPAHCRQTVFQPSRNGRNTKSNPFLRLKTGF